MEKLKLILMGLLVVAMMYLALWYFCCLPDGAIGKY